MIPASIPPLVFRHAQDAAFYWMQRDSSLDSPYLRLEKLAYFDAMLDAHLEGLWVAQAEGWSRTLADLKRWKGPAEAFVCAWLAVVGPDAQRRREVMAAIGASADGCLRGVISALAWAPLTLARTALLEWSAPEAGELGHVAALRATALIEPPPDTPPIELAAPLEAYSRCAAAPVRAAACRVAAHFSDAHKPAWLEALMADPVDAVRAEAAIALLEGGRREALSVLWRCVAAQIPLAAALTGWPRKLALRRLDRWVRVLAARVALGDAAIPALIERLPVRESLLFVLYHADPAYLPFVVAQMKGETFARRAGWVWQCMTDIDLEREGLTKAQPGPNELPSETWLTKAGDNIDSGLPVPDADAVTAWLARQPALAGGRRVMAGRTLDVAGAKALLDTAPQGLRAVAASFLAAHSALPPVNPRARASVQRRHSQPTASEVPR